VGPSDEFAEVDEFSGLNVVGWFACLDVLTKYLPGLSRDGRKQHTFFDPSALNAGGLTPIDNRPQLTKLPHLADAWCIVQGGQHMHPAEVVPTPAEEIVADRIYRFSVA